MFMWWWFFEKKIRLLWLFFLRDLIDFSVEMQDWFLILFCFILSQIYSQWCGLGGNSLGCATVELAKLLKAADEGLMQSGTRLQFIWSCMKRCNLSLTFETQVNSRSQRSSKGRSATGSKSVVYRLGPLPFPAAFPAEPEAPFVLPVEPWPFPVCGFEFVLDPLLVQQAHIHEWYLSRPSSR